MSNLAEQIKKEQEKSKREHLDLAFKLQLKAVGLSDGWQCEYQFDKARKWRFDFALIKDDKKLAIEVEGGTYTSGRHVRGTGYAKDCEKYNTASAQGWTLFRFTSDMIKSGKAILFVQDYLGKC